MGVRTNAGALSRYGAHRQTITERQFTSDEMSGKTNAKIRGNATAQSPIGLHRLVFPGWQPKLNSWQVLADLDDFPQVIEALQVAGIMPAEVAIPGAVDEGRYRIHPTGIREAGEALFHGSLNLPKDVPTAKRVTVVTDGCRKLLQETAKPASSRWKRIAVAGHLSRLAQGAADGKRLFHPQRGYPLGFHLFLAPNRNRWASR